MITALIRRYPLVVFFVVAFSIAWGGVAVVAGLFGPSLLVMFIPIGPGLVASRDARKEGRIPLAHSARWMPTPSDRTFS